jgi:hypothetical protein
MPSRNCTQHQQFLFSRAYYSFSILFDADQNCLSRITDALKIWQNDQDSTYLPRLLEVGYAIPTADQNLFLSWIEEQVALEIPPASSFA